MSPTVLGMGSNVTSSINVLLVTDIKNKYCYYLISDFCGSFISSCSLFVGSIFYINPSTEMFGAGEKFYFMSLVSKNGACF